LAKGLAADAIVERAVNLPDQRYAVKDYFPILRFFSQGQEMPRLSRISE
jgi:hypothetical protein